MLEPLLLAAALMGAEAGTYEVDPEGSEVRIQVGKGGLFAFAGHEHVVVAPVAEGRVVVDAAGPERSLVRLSFEAGALRVTGEGEPADDVPKVQEAMLSEQVLDAARFPAIAFRSRRVRGSSPEPGVWALEVYGELALHGRIRELSFPVEVALREGVLEAGATFTLEQRDFGIEPLSVAGVVKVKDQLEITVRIRARRRTSD